MLNNNTGVFPTIHIPYIINNENINNINYEKHYILPCPVSVSPAHLLGSQPTYIRTMLADISLWYTHILMYLLQCQNISDFHTVGESKSVSAAHSSVIKEKTKCLFCCWQSCQPNTQLHFTLFQALTQSGLADFPDSQGWEPTDASRAALPCTLQHCTPLCFHDLFHLLWLSHFEAKSGF